MGEKGKRDKGRRESKKKAKLTIKEKRREKKDKTTSGSNLSKSWLGSKENPASGYLYFPLIRFESNTAQSHGPISKPIIGLRWVLPLIDFLCELSFPYIIGNDAIKNDYHG